MATSYTSLLGLALPVTGELSGTWGTTVNTEITELLDSAVAGTTTLSSDADVTLTTTTGAANTSRQIILLWTAGGTVTRNITAPAQSKVYVVINKSSSTQSIVLRGAGPTTGVTIVVNEKAVCAWNGSDFVKISSTVITNLTGTLPVANGGTGVTTSTGTGNTVLSTSPTLVTPALGTPSSGVVTNLTGTASININGTVGATTASTGAFTTLSATGVASFADGTAALPSITNIGDTNTGISFPAADTIAFSEGGAEAMRIDSSGNLLVGTTSSSLSGQSVNGIIVSRAGGALLGLNNSSNTNQAWNHWIYDSGLGAAGTYAIGQIINGSTGGVAGGPFTPIFNMAVPSAASNSPKVTIDASGNVGIGTTTPVAQLGVYGTGQTTAAMSTSSGLGGTLYVRDSGSASGNGGVVMFGANQGAFAAIKGLITEGANNTLGALAFSNRNASTDATLTERMRISPAGGFSVGTTSDPGAGAIYATGNITAFFSDDRLKTKLGGIQDALAKVKTLSGFYYEPNQTAQDLGYKAIREVGVSAQQVQAVMPEVVVPAPIDDKYLTVRYEKLIPLLIEAIKELDAKVESLTKA